MPLEIVRNDITRMEVDAIVNAANRTLLGGGGVDGAIHRAAGPGLIEECRRLDGCEPGNVRVTGAYRLKARYVIHTVGPIWHGGGHGERALLRSCYEKALAAAKKYECESIAFPLISAGAYGYPREEALQVAVDAIRAFLLDNDMTVYIVVFDKASFGLSEKLVSSVRAYIDDRYADQHRDVNRRARCFSEQWEIPVERCVECEPDADAAPFGDHLPAKAGMPRPEAAKVRAPMDIMGARSLSGMLKNLDESFSQAVLRLIDEKDMTDVACYKRANLDRKLFSKIRSDVQYKPSKRTALALAIALELDMEETGALLKKAGLALSGSNEFDVIIEYFIVNRIYDIYEINKTLFYFDQVPLGA